MKLNSIAMLTVLHFIAMLYLTIRLVTRMMHPTTPKSSLQ
jgi:hypothetical protein